MSDQKDRLRHSTDSSKADGGCLVCDECDGDTDHTDPHDCGHDRTEPRCARCGMSSLSTLHLGEPGHAFVERCPECDTGHVVADGPMEWDTGHHPFRCSERCGWTS